MTTGAPKQARSPVLDEARAIVQRWLDSSETSYPGHRALRDLAVLHGLERRRVSPAMERTSSEWTRSIQRR